MTEKRPVALVIGAGSGIGAAAAKHLSSRGYDIAVMSRSEKIEEVATSVGGLAIRGSLTEEADIERAISETIASFGSLDAVVNSSGHAVKKPVLEITDAEWLEGANLYLLNVIRLTRFVTPYFESRGGGSIVNVSTSSPFEPSSKFPVSATMRAALASYTKLYTNEYGPAGIRMNNVLPGYTTADWESIPSEWTAGIPLRRAAHPDEIANVIGFLVSDESSYITGQNLRADGGSARSV